jgi:aspartate 1-decarboxylase
MRRTLLHSKIHRATVTGSDINYVGSITLDPELLDAADILVHEKVAVVDIDNGSRFETYVAEGERGSGDAIINGAAARLVHRGDLIIIFAFASLEAHELETHEPRIVHVDRSNRVISEAEAQALTSAALVG